MPMIVRWPGKVPAGNVSSFPWTFTDVMPTAADLAGIKPPENMDGISVLPALLGKTQEPHKHLYWEFYDPFHQAVRMGNFKGVRFGTEAPMQLYDLVKDPGEDVDIADKYPEICKTMRDVMIAEHTDTPYWPTQATTRKKTKKKK